jgi:tRNA1Val (adenine37-N6)-methyltransferase
MSNSYFQFKQFTIHQDRCAMKVTTDTCLFGAWVSRFQETNAKFQILDIGTGTALLSLMYAQKHHCSIIDSIEIDKEAFEQAKENAAISPFADRVHVIHGDVKIFSFTKKYDLIISNPPFYAKEILSGSERKNIAHHHSGLLIEELLLTIKRNLSLHGVFYLLLPFKRNEEIKKILLNQNLFVHEIVFVRQSSKHDYFRIMIKGNLKKEDQAETIIDEISIWDDQQQYTKDFKELLKDYYWNL